MRNTHHSPPASLPGGRRDVRLKRLIWEILMDAPNKEMQLQTLYMQMQERHINLATRQSDWRGTVRHILSAGPYFRRVRDNERRGCWRINDDYAVLSSVREADTEPQSQGKVESGDGSRVHWQPQLIRAPPAAPAPTVKHETTGLTKKRSFSQPNVMFASLSEEKTPIVPTVKLETETFKARSYSQSDVSSVVTTAINFDASSLSPFTSSSQSSTPTTSSAGGTLDTSPNDLLAQLAEMNQYQFDHARRQMLQHSEQTQQQGRQSSQADGTFDHLTGNKQHAIVDTLAQVVFQDAATLSPTDFLDHNYFPNWSAIEGFNFNTNTNGIPTLDGNEHWQTECHPAMRGDVDSLATFRF